MFLSTLVNLVILFQSGILPRNSGEDQKKFFAAFWIYLSPKFRISCCKVGITCQKNEGARHILPPGPPIIDAYASD